MGDATFISQATTKICGTLDPNAVLKRSFDFLRTYMPVDSISMSAYDPSTRSLTDIAHHMTPDFAKTLKMHILSPPPDKPLQVPPDIHDYIMAHTVNSCTIVNSPDKSPGGKFVCERLGIKDLSFMVLKVDIGGEIQGHIIVSARGIRLYSKEHARLLRIIRDPFSVAMTNAIHHQEVVRLKDLLNEDNRYLFSKLHQNSEEAIIGKDKGLRDVMKTVLKVARLNSAVMLVGETGAGKEVIANAIHYNSKQANGPFVKINCGAIPDNLIDSELFGHQKGAFTGALSNKRGHFERAHNGTLFLDEIGDLPHSAQVRLLRVLQQKEVLRVGGTEPIKINVRIITATHHDLEEKVENGEFREDLWFRINVFPIKIPPLRQRTDDIPALVEYFIDRKSQEMNLKFRPRVSAEAIKRLKAYSWPGNVRELENSVERALIHNAAVHHNTVLEFDEIEGAIHKLNAKGFHLKSHALMSCDDAMRRHFQEVLKSTGGRINGENGAAAILKINPNTLRHRLRKLGVSFGRT